MKIFIDKGGGRHYHKPDCKIVNGEFKAGKFTPNYEPVEHDIKKFKYTDYYREIKVGGRYYVPCPFCFGDGNRR